MRNWFSFFSVKYIWTVLEYLSGFKLLSTDSSLKVDTIWTIKYPFYQGREQKIGNQVIVIGYLMRIT